MLVMLLVLIYWILVLVICFDKMIFLVLIFLDWIMLVRWMYLLFVFSVSCFLFMIFNNLLGRMCIMDMVMCFVKEFDCCVVLWFWNELLDELLSRVLLKLLVKMFGKFIWWDDLFDLFVDCDLDVENCLCSLMVRILLICVVWWFIINRFCDDVL